MKKLSILLVLILSVISCYNGPDPDSYFINERFVIVSSSESDGLTHDKFHKPIFVKTWLIQRVNDTTYYRELSSYNSYNNFIITNELWYNKGIGDTLYFDYILKSEFFKIYNKKIK